MLNYTFAGTKLGHLQGSGRPAVGEGGQSAGGVSVAVLVVVVGVAAGAAAGHTPKARRERAKR